MHTRTSRTYAHNIHNGSQLNNTNLSLFDKLLCNHSAHNELVNSSRINDLESCGICLITVNDAIQIGIKAFIAVFSLDSSGIFNSIVKILQARLNQGNQKN